MNHAGIYRIVDSLTWRFYIGSSVNIGKRWRQHTYRLARGTHPNPILQAIYNDCPRRLSIEVVKKTGRGRETLLQAEQSFLDAACVGQNRQCMNVLEIAGSHLGRKRSDATRAALAAAQVGKVASAEARAKMRAAKIGRKQAPEHVAKVRPHLLAGNARRWERDRGKPSAKRILSPSQVAEFQAKRSAGWKLHDLRRHFKVSYGTAQRLAAGESYRELRCV